VEAIGAGAIVGVFQYDLRALLADGEAEVVGVPEPDAMASVRGFPFNPALALPRSNRVEADLFHDVEDVGGVDVPEAVAHPLPRGRGEDGRGEGAEAVAGDDGGHGSALFKLREDAMRQAPSFAS
jgi:hypothetical protein